MIYLDKNGNKPLYEQLYDKLKTNIVEGNLPKDASLDSVRVMAKILHISRNTVDRAYQQLLAEGYIRSVPGSGFYVEDITNDYFETVETVTNHFRKIVDERPRKRALRYDFLYDSMDAELFPWTKWKRFVQDAVMEESFKRRIPYEPNKGSLELRTCLCEFLSHQRGVKCEPDQIVLCAGTQMAVDILTNLLPCDQYRLGYEEPGYDAMRNIFLQKGYGVTSIPVEEGGINDMNLKNSECNLLYLTPSHQFPTGEVTTIKKRKKILKWAEKKNAYIIENDYDSEFRYGTVPIPSLQSLDNASRVIYVGTLSKVMLPTIRCAYLVLPRQLLKKYDRVYHYYNSALPGYHQRAIAHFIESGSLDKHIRRMSYINSCKYEMLLDAMKTYLKDQVIIYEQPAGVHTLIRIPHCRNQKELLKELKECEIGLYGTKQYYYNQEAAREDTFLMGFNSMSEEEIWQGCKSLGKALEMYFK